MFGPAEVSACLELAFVMEDYVRGGGEKSSEVRLRMDALGLSAKGKRDLRWRSPSEASVVDDAGPGRPKMAEVRRLRAVETKAG
jgi:hypothetical protein